MSSRAKIVIIGAGPAGLAAAAEASKFTEGIVLVDSSEYTGGQYWRHGARDEKPGAAKPKWHHGWKTYLKLKRRINEAVAAGKVTVLSGMSVNSLGALKDGRFHVGITPTPELATENVAPRSIEAESVVLCTGAYDRQLPVPGWTLPGVMAAGGIQAFIKTQNQAPGRRVLLAGTGPFLLAAAASIIHAGAEVAGICEHSDLSGWIPRGATGMLVPTKAGEGVEYGALLARHRIPYLRRTAVTHIHGNNRVSSVTVSRVDADGRPLQGAERTFKDIDVVGLGWGFVPQLELLLQTDAETCLGHDGSLVGVVDAQQESTIPGLFLAGEVTGVAGAIGAVVEGRIAGRTAAEKSARIPVRDQAARLRHRIFAQAMHFAHPEPKLWLDRQPDDTTVCRCEEVELGELRTAIRDLGASDPRSMKGMTRAGMGYCQGRICGSALRCLNQSRSEEQLEEARATSKRPLALPIRTGDLANIYKPSP